MKLPETVGGHPGLIKNFSEAILKGKPLVAPGAEGLASLEIINGIYLSSYTEKPVSLPLPRAAYTKLLNSLKAAGKKAVHRPGKPSPLTKSGAIRKR